MNRIWRTSRARWRHEGPEQLSRRLNAALMGSPAVALLLLIAGSLSASADVVESRQGRLLGKAVFAEQVVRVQDRAIGWTDVMFVLRQEAGDTVAAPQALHMAGGEIWRVHLLRLTGKKLRVISSLLGERDVDLSVVRMLDLVPDAGDRAGDVPGMLYREGAEAVPCTLMWINDTRVSVDSTLGILTLPREGSLRYVNSATATTRPAGLEDEVRLIDGSTFRGRAAVGADRIELDHATMGRLSIPASAVRGVIRAAVGVTYITKFSRQQMQSLGVAGPVSAIPAVAATAEGMHRIVLQPRTVVRYPLPRPGGTLRLTQRSVETARGDSLVRVRADEKLLLEQKVSPADPAAVVSLELGEAKELTVEVDFASAPIFPCGVLWLDPVLVSK